MWIADNWKEYEVIDCSNGEKLERWGDYILVRPDPQVIWDTPKTRKEWRRKNGHYHRSKKGGGERLLPIRKHREERENGIASAVPFSHFSIDAVTFDISKAPMPL